MLILRKSILWMFRFFAGACIFRFLSVVTERSLTLQEKSGGCKVQNPVRNFAVEVLGGTAFVGCAIRYGCGNWGILSLKGMVLLIYLGILMMAALTDWKTRIIYDKFHIMIMLLAVINTGVFQMHSVKNSLLGAVIIAGPMLILAIIIPGAFGGGDIKLMAVSGLFLGTASIICAMVLGLFTGGVYSALMLKCGKLSRKDSFAFGPFLAMGLAAAAFYGDQIVSWYLHFMA